MGKTGKNFILYRIWYGDSLVYLGRTKQSLQTQIRGHLLRKSRYITISIDQVTKIEYAEFKSEADMLVYEIYFINLYKPPLNHNDKSKDELHVILPDIEWKLFRKNLWIKWKDEVLLIDNLYKKKKSDAKELFSEMNKKRVQGEITEDEFFDFWEQNYKLLK